MYLYACECASVCVCAYLLLLYTHTHTDAAQRDDVGFHVPILNIRAMNDID